MTTRQEEMERRQLARLVDSVERIEELEAENAKLKEALNSIVEDYQHTQAVGGYGSRESHYFETALAALLEASDE